MPELSTKINGTEKSAEIKAEYKKFIGRKILFISFTFILIIIIAGIAATLGPYQISVLEVYSIVWHGIPKILQNLDFILSHSFKDFSLTYFTKEESIIWFLRLPPIVMAILAGVGLGIAGTTMQGVVRNPFV